MDYALTYVSLLGTIQLISNGLALTGLRTEFWRDRTKDENIYQNGSFLPVLKETASWLDIYFKGSIPDFTPQLQLSGTDFQKQVWQILLGIPYGKFMTYGEIAKLIARQRGISQMSAQAVGRAVGANPIGIIIPCHRVIGARGNLTGYAGGLKTKSALLELEGIDTTKFVMPKTSRFL